MKSAFAAAMLLALTGAILPARAADATTPAAAATGSAVAAATANAAKSPDVDEHGYLKLGFDQLASYTFNPPSFDPAANPNAKPPTGEEQIPAGIKAWNGKKAVITGYMVPVK